MVATYDQTLMTPKDRMRFALGDIDMAAPLRDDETYQAVLAAHDETLGTAVMAESLVMEYARQPDSVSLGDASVSWRERIGRWAALATRLRAKAAADAAPGVVGGVASTGTYRDGDQGRAEYARGSVREVFGW